MKSFKYNRLFIAALFLFVFISCKKNEYNSEVNLPRQFKPGDINITAGETQAVLEWLPSLFTTVKNATYTVEVAKDATFQNIEYSTIVDTSMTTITDSILAVGQDYFARVKANASGSTKESGWVTSSSFKITGEQIFFQVQDAELKDTSVVLRWRTSPGVTKIVITPNGRTAFEVPLDAADVAAEQKQVGGLTELTTYTAEIYKNAIKKGTITFTTKEHSIYSVILSAGDDLATAVNDAADGDIIGLADGTYDLGATSSGFSVDSKNITIASVSGNASEVTILNSDFVLKGTGAGIKLSGLGLTGPQSGYIIDVNSSATDIGDITIENCRISFLTNGYAILRANRPSSATMGTLTITNTVGVGINLNNNYAIAMMDKMKFTAVVIKNSTFSTFQRTIVSAATAISGWSATVSIDRCTFNDFGNGGKAAVLEGSSNDITLNVSNTIFANTPITGGNVSNDAVKFGGFPAFEKVFYYNCTNGASPADPINWPPGAATTTDISWTAATTDFTLPAGSSLRTAGTDNGPVGDPRWAQ
ncbi:MAG: hypothetical protein ACTHMD_17065 [Flavisolibacter sp.]